MWPSSLISEHFSSPLKETLFSPPPSPWQPLISFLLSLSVMLSRFIHIVACVSASLLFIDGPHFVIHSSIDRHLGCVHFGAMMTNSALNNLVQVFVWTFSPSLFSLLFCFLASVSFSLHISLSRSVSVFLFVPFRLCLLLPVSLGLLHPSSLSPPSPPQHFMKPLQRFLKPQDVEIIFINIEVNWPIPALPDFCLVGMVYWLRLSLECGGVEDEWHRVGGWPFSHLASRAPGSRRSPYASLRVGPASRAHPLPKGDEGSPGQPQCTHPLPGLHQIQGEVRPSWPAQTSGGHPALSGHLGDPTLIDHWTERAFPSLLMGKGLPISG